MKNQLTKNLAHSVLPIQTSKGADGKAYSRPPEFGAITLDF